MKVLATIKAVEVIRQFPHQDGTYGNVYGVTIESGDDQIIAETFRTAESQKRDGIVPGAVGTAMLEFSISRGVSKNGNAYTSQRIALKRFDLANKGINTEAISNAEAEHAEAMEQQTPEQVAEEAKEAVAQAQENGTGMPF